MKKNIYEHNFYLLTLKYAINRILMRYDAKGVK